MKNYYAKQFQPAVKLHSFKSMKERDDWVQRHYDKLVARHCSVAEVKKLDDLISIVVHEMPKG